MNDSLSKSQTLRLHKPFKESREDVTDEPHSGRLSTSQIDEYVKRMRDRLNSNQRLSLQRIAQTLQMTKTTVYRVLTENSNMKNMFAKPVSKVLTDKQYVHLRVPVPRTLGNVFKESYFFLNQLLVPYNPDLAAPGFFLFSRLKGKHWNAIENIQAHVVSAL